MDAEYGARYRELFERHWWWRARELVILDALRRHRPASGWGAVLDVGCGDGLFFDRLLAVEGVSVVEGVEPAAALVSDDGPHRGRINVVPFDASFQPGRRYSLILMLDVLEHLPDPAAALRHAVELLEPDGVILVTLPALQALWTRHDELNHHFTRYSVRSARALASDGSIAVREVRYFFRWVALPKLLTRAVEAVVPGEPAAPSMPSRPLNALWLAASRLEERLLGRLPIPFGSSLLMVGGRGQPE